MQEKIGNAFVFLEIFLQLYCHESNIKSSKTFMKGQVITVAAHKSLSLKNAAHGFQ